MWTFARELWPFSRKSFFSFCLLSLIWISLLTLPSPVDQGVFALGTILLSTDYRVLETVGLDSVYQYVIEPDLAKEADRSYRRKKFAKEGPNSLRLTTKRDGDFQATVTKGSNHLFEGMRFRLYVKAPYEGLNDDDVEEYDLRLALLQVTETKPATDPETDVVFFSVVDWESEFQDEAEEEFAQEVHSRLTGGDDSDRPFAKVYDTDGVNQYTIEQWSAISDWTSDHTK